MLLEINLVLLLVSAVFASPAISDNDEKGLKSDSDDKITNSIDDSSDDRSKRSYESGGYQWGSPNQADPFNPAYSPPNNAYGSGNNFPSSSNNPFQQSPFDRGQPNNNYEKNPLQEVMGRALESVIVASVRQLLDMTPLGTGGQGDFRSARSARSVENVFKISDSKQVNPEKVNFIEKLGDQDVKDSHSLEKREIFSGEEDDDSEEDPELIRQQILQQNFIKEMKRRKRMRQQAYQQSLKKNQEKINSQKINQQNTSRESWEQGMNDEQKLEYLSNYQKQLMDLYREKENKERVDKKIRGGSKQSSRYSPPQQARSMIGDYPINRQDDLFSKYDNRNNNKVKQPFLSQKYSSQSEISNSKIGKEGFEQGQGFIRQNVEETPKNLMMNSMGARSNVDWSKQPWDQSSQYFQQQGGIKDNRIKKLGSKSMIMDQLIKPDVSTQEGWRPQVQQTTQNQQFFNEFSPRNGNTMSPQIPQMSNGIPGKQRFQRISTNEICKDGFTPSGVPCTMDGSQPQMNDGSFMSNSPSNQEILLQPPTLIKRYVTYSNRFIPPPSAVVEPVTDQEMFSGEGKPQNNIERTNSIGGRFSEGGIFSSQEQRSQANEGMMNGWTGPSSK